MSTRALSAILATAAALGLAACGGDETVDSAEPATTPLATVTETVAETQSDTVTETEPADTEAETDSETEAETETVTETNPELEVVVIRVEGGEAKGGANTITVKQGDRVRIRVVVDEPQEIHLHGYEIEQEAAPARPALFAFKADLEGIFDLETHLTDAKIGKLVVEP
jgi:FtsP/CotA-like multicopper oxidase with cupredoxin domain